MCNDLEDETIYLEYTQQTQAKTRLLNEKSNIFDGKKVAN